MTDEGAQPTTPAAAGPEYDQRLIVAVLACVGISIGGAILGLGVMVGMSKSSIPLAPVMLTLLLIQVPGAIAALVLSILGGMWRRGLDGVTTAVLLVTTLGADLMLWPFMATQTNVSIVGFGQCVSPLGSCSSDGTADLWIGVGVQTLLLALVLTCMAHWLWRLRPASFAQRNNRLAMLAVGFVLAAVVAAIDGSISTTVSVNISDSTGPNSDFGSFPPVSPGSGSGTSGGTVILSNDLGRSVRVVYCPHQNCTHQKARTMASGATAPFHGVSTSMMPDSFVVLSTGAAPVCQTVDPNFEGAGSMNIQPLSSADRETCGLDVQTLTVPH